MKALYRKYRPTKLADVIGQDQVIKPLSESLKQHKLNHAYVFAGPRGTGKTSVARIFAHAVNDFDYQLEDDYLDIIEIDAASNNGVDNIRELREKAIIAPTKGTYKVYIIDEAHMLTKSAANALLKLLEEPPEHVIFVMATTELDKIPVTILSRTQVYNFNLAEPEIMLQHLTRIARDEQIQIDESGLKVIVKRGGGSFRDSLSLLDQVATLTDDKITAEILEKALGVPSQEKIKSLLVNYQAGNTDGIQQDFKALLGSGLRAENIASELLSEIIVHPEAETLPLLRSLPEVTAPFAEAKLLLALLENRLGATNTRKIQVADKKTSAKVAPTSSPNEESAKLATDPGPSVDSESDTDSAPNISPESNVSSDPVTYTSETAPGDFSWSDFVTKVNLASASTAKPLEKSKYELKDGKLHIYPDTNFSARILQSAKHGAVLRQALDNAYDLKVHDAGAISQPKDETVAKISAIMGNVQEIDDVVPF